LLTVGGIVRIEKRFRGLIRTHRIVAVAGCWPLMASPAKKTRLKKEKKPRIGAKTG